MNHPSEQLPDEYDVAAYSVRPLTPSDQDLLWEMLYLSLYVPEGGRPFAREIVRRPEIARYARGWGREHDSGFVAEDARGVSVGAAWLRLFRGGEGGYGYVDDDTPELGMAVLPEHRGRGVGTTLLARLLASEGGRYDAVSLSVGAGNPAIRLYERAGFEVVGVAGDAITMKRRRDGR